MSTEQNKAVVRRFMQEVLVKQNYSILDEVITTDYVNHGMPGMAISGREGLLGMQSMLSKQFPDLKMSFDILDMIAEGDKVVVRALTRVKNAGKEVSGEGLGEYRLVNGKIVEDWPLTGARELMMQVGIRMPESQTGR